VRTFICGVVLTGSAFIPNAPTPLPFGMGLMAVAGLSLGIVLCIAQDLKELGLLTKKTPPGRAL
jgi:hypothetical protein